MSESGDLIYPLEKGIISKENFIPAGQLIRGIENPGTTRVFKSVGMALFDLFAAKLIFESQ